MSRKMPSVPEFLVGKDSYNKLLRMLDGEPEKQELLHKAALEQHLLTMYQTANHSNDLTCPRWRRQIRKWEENVMSYYEEQYGVEPEEEKEV